MDRNLSPKGMILDICSQRSRARKLIDKFPEYSALLKYLTDQDYYNDDDLSIPSIKQIAESINLTYDKVRRQMKKVYSQLTAYENLDEFPFGIENTNVTFYVKGFYESCSLMISGLKFLPRKGEQVHLPYFKELLGTDYFHVSSVNNEFLDTEHRICIWLNIGSFNSYWDLRKDQAVERGEISLMDSFKEDSELKRMLDINRGKAW